MTKFSLSIVFVVALGVTASAQVQQPAVTASTPSSAKTFFAPEILGSRYAPDRVMLEHPSKPSSMRVPKLIRQARALPNTRPIVTPAKQKVCPAQNLFDAVKGASAEVSVRKPARSTRDPLNDLVPPPPGAE